MVTMKTSPWLKNSPNAPIEMSSRIRLARNLEGLTYPHLIQDKSEYDEVTKTISNKYKDFEVIKMDDLTEIEKQLMIEKFLISPLFKRRGHSLIVSEDESTSIMAGEEDHIRIQVMNVGHSLEELYEIASDIDDTIEKDFDYQFDRQYGFKTACPTNVGTGLRASVMLHLPALTRNNRIRRLRDVLTRMGYTLRGIYGEGSNPVGDVYQLSNQVTLGLSELEIIHHLDEIKEQIIYEETRMREWFYHNRALTVRDAIFRSYGLLRYAEQMSLDEAAMHLSHIKYGVDMNVLELENFEFQALLKQIQHAFIRQGLEDVESVHLEAAENKARATFLKRTLGGK